MSIEMSKALLFALNICEAFSLKNILTIILPKNKGQYIKMLLGLLMKFIKWIRWYIRTIVSY